jgi:hypothetical protein
LVVGSRDELETMTRVVTHLRLQPVIDRCFRFEDTPACFRYFVAGSAHFGKVLIEM